MEGGREGEKNEEREGELNEGKERDINEGRRQKDEWRKDGERCREGETD